MRPRPMRALPVALGLLLLGGPAAAQSPSVSPVPFPTTAPAATPDPLRDFQDQPGTATTPGGFGWQQVDGPVQSRRARLDDLMTWSGGFLAVEWRERRREDERATAVWQSPDGRRWDRAPLPRLDGSLLGIVPFQGGLALLTTDQRVSARSSGRVFRIRAWRSTDAIAWRDVGSFSDAVPAASDPGWQWALGDPLAVNGRLILVAHLRDSSIGMGGWLGSPWAMQGAQARRVSTNGEEQLVAWSSPDGATWSKAPVTGLGDLPDLTTWSPAGVRAFGPRLTESRDGITWERVAPRPPFYEWGGPDGLLWADGSSVVYGDNFDGEGAEGCGNRQSVWRLEPGGWVETLDRQAMAVYGADADGSTVILVGSSWCLPTDDLAEWAWILVSNDGGRTWDPEASWVGATGTCLGDVAIHGDTAVLLACGIQTIRDAPHPAFWVASVAAPDASPAP